MASGVIYTPGLKIKVRFYGFYQPIFWNLVRQTILASHEIMKHFTGGHMSTSSNLFHQEGTIFKLVRACQKSELTCRTGHLETVGLSYLGIDWSGWIFLTYSRLILHTWPRANILLTRKRWNVRCKTPPYWNPHKLYTCLPPQKIEESRWKTGDKKYMSPVPYKVRSHNRDTSA